MLLKLIVMILVQIHSFHANLRTTDAVTFSTGTAGNEKPSVMENIFTSKPIGVTTNSNPTRFKETSAQSNFENPVIVRTKDRTYNDITSRVADGTTQAISNSAAFDIQYKNRQAFYDERKLFIFDKNFNDMENYLLDNFKKQIDSGINYSASITHASDIDRHRLNVNTKDAPYITRHSVGNTLSEGGYKTDSSVKKYSTDPYHHISRYNQ